MRLLITFLYVFMVVKLSLATDTLDSDIKNVDIDVFVDLTSHLAQITSTIKLTNEGIHSPQAFHFALDPYISSKLSFIGAKEVEDDTDIAVLNVEGTTIDNEHKDAKFYRINFSKPLKPRATITIVVETVYSDSMSPLPKQVQQDDNQLVKYTANLYHYTPYHTTSAVVTIKVASKNVESYSQIRPVNVNEDTITYGPFNDLSPYKKQKFSLHFENNSPFLTTWRLDRWIEVSHWGNIAVEEKLHIQHTGAILKGSFSRYEYQKNPYGGSPSAIRSFRTVLPASATDVYYRDEIGNISTSHLQELQESVEVEIRPRFPLFGGWQTRYTIGYNLPSYEYLYQLGSQYALKMRFMDHVYDNQFVDEIVLSIVLPEGSQDIKFDPPYPVDSESTSLHYTYLDTIGRPLLTITKRNLVENHIEDFTISYSFNSIMLLQEPLLLFTAFFLVFVVVIISVRLDFSIVEDQDALAKMQLKAVREDYCYLFEKKLSLSKKIITNIDKFRANKDRQAFKSVKNQLETDRKHINNKIAVIEKENKFPPDIASKMAELSQKDNLLKQNLEQTVSLFDRPAKISNIQSQEDKLTREREELTNQMRMLLSVL
ncbi:Dolichyl-diphosphooligosaccharide--protein glycosyltransferase subunit 1 [Oopsacas minuta]|uniref:Dolichyl-diphosphooligosaccharide--protein glycosyltransferase subunit 1 n=1 Tax=Oopsacas minuta TaxID=111878 RepID=A0AAV7JZ54_9METZ|nr:Dolichyl-diphosphooligosaccharide--protein glycosyltransferase subunit 1 [Oopsacas minuta]